MPAVYAHYKFGKEVYRELPRDIKQILNENRPGFLLGLHGPDLLFYYRCFSVNRVNQLGRKMHHEIAEGFFSRGREVYQEHPSYVLLSYLCGFMCHFMLDSECHPFIGDYVDELKLGHLEIETDFDRLLMEEDDLDPTRHCCTGHLIRDLDTEEAISSVLDRVSAGQVDEAIIGFKRVIKLFQCPWEGKAKLLRGAFTLVGQRKGLAGLVMDGVPNEDCALCSAVLKDRMESAVKPAAEEIVRYVEDIEGDGPLSDRLNRDFE